MMTFLRRRPLGGILLCLLFIAVGCKPKLQGFSGSVTYDGRPLDGALITFIPDAEKGNMMGASNVASVREGRYELPESQGISGGWYRVMVEASQAVESEEGGSERHRFPPFTISHEFKPDDKTFDIDIPGKK